MGVDFIGHASFSRIVVKKLTL